MRIELNYREYRSELHSTPFRCQHCAWKILPVQYCAKFCCQEYIFETVKITSSIFHL